MCQLPFLLRSCCLSRLRLGVEGLVQTASTTLAWATSLHTQLPTSLAAKMMVVSCERSPHSARKVRVKAWMKMGETRLCHFFCGTAVPVPASTSGAPFTCLDRWSCKDEGPSVQLANVLTLQQQTKTFHLLVLLVPTITPWNASMHSCIPDRNNQDNSHLWQQISFPPLSLENGLGSFQKAMWAADERVKLPKPPAVFAQENV